MSAPIPVLATLTTPLDFPGAVRDWVLQEAGRQRDAFAGQGVRPLPSESQHFAVLQGLVEYLRTQCLDPLDQRLVALAAISRGVIEIERQRGNLPDGAPAFLATFNQRRILSVVGQPQNLPASPPEQILEEIVAAGAQDLIESVRQDRERLRKAAHDAEQATAAAMSRAEMMEVDQEAFETARVENESLRGEIGERDEIIEQLQLRLGDRDVPRRVRVEPGIYRNPRTGAIEVWRPKSAGGPKHETVDSLDEARTLRAEFAGEPVPSNSGDPGDDDDVPGSGDSAAALETALNAREKELGRELTEEEIEAIDAETSTPSATAAGGED